MSKKFGIIVAIALLGATPALAQNATCTEPTPVTMIDGTTVTREQLLATIALVKDFVAKSDFYQQCIADDLELKKAAAAKASTPFDSAIQQVALAKVAANQQAKDKLVADVNGQAAIFKQRTAAK